MINIGLAQANLERRSRLLNQKLTSHKAAKQFYTKGTLIAHNLRQKSVRLLAGAGLTGSILFTPVAMSGSAPAAQEAKIDTRTIQEKLAQSLQSITPHSPAKLESEEAAKIEETITSVTGLKAVAELQGQSLNHQVGYIGYEQHLKRFPGDDLYNHDDEQIAGLAPGLGAWGYFAKNQSSFTTEDFMREKYYSVAQTLYIPNWNQDFVKLRDWYQYRKVLIINPVNGAAVVSNIADAGPAHWTGKQFGGSPEVMKALNLHLGSRKGLVIYLFLDDPNNLVPLGPLDHKYNV